MGVAGVLGIASVFPWPPALVGAMVVQQALNGIILGVILGWFGRSRGSVRDRKTWPSLEPHGQ